ncbi:MAG: hypothetical protein FWC16_08680 [Defluviitaleaceae bacterium]|nr:hypothetical protein [Defluviitaleaceae bacterium]MCL2274986.1 hypothetical protein [Defluviitaleaceae bacterium]
MIKTKFFATIKHLMLFAFILFWLIHIFPIPVRIEAPAIEIMLNDDGHFYERVVRINGWYRINLFSHHRFNGQIEISGYPKTFYDMERLLLHRNAFARGRFDLMFYAGQRFSVLYTRWVFNDAAIMLPDENGHLNSSTSPFVVLHKLCRLEAMDVLNIFGHVSPKD